MNSRICFFLFFLVAFGDSNVLESTNVDNPSHPLEDLPFLSEKNFGDSTENSKNVDSSRAEVATKNLKSENLDVKDPALVRSDAKGVAVNQDFDDENGHRHLAGEGSGEKKEKPVKVKVDLTVSEKITRGGVEYDYGTVVIISYCIGECTTVAEELSVITTFGHKCIPKGTKAKFKVSAKFETFMMDKEYSFDETGDEFCFLWGTSLVSIDKIQYAEYYIIQEVDKKESNMYLMVETKPDKIVLKQKQFGQEAEESNDFTVAAYQRINGRNVLIKDFKFRVKPESDRSSLTGFTKLEFSCFKKSITSDFVYTIGDVEYKIPDNARLKVVLPAPQNGFWSTCEKGKFLEAKELDKDHRLVLI